MNVALDQKERAALYVADCKDTRSRWCGRCRRRLWQPDADFVDVLLRLGCRC